MLQHFCHSIANKRSGRCGHGGISSVLQACKRRQGSLRRPRSRGLKCWTSATTVLASKMTASVLHRCWRYRRKNLPTMPERWRIIFGHLASNQLANFSPAARYLVRVTSDTGKSFSGPSFFLDSWRRAFARAGSPPFAILMDRAWVVFAVAKSNKHP